MFPTYLQFLLLILKVKTTLLLENQIIKLTVAKNTTDIVTEDDKKNDDTKDEINSDNEDQEITTEEKELKNS